MSPGRLRDETHTERKCCSTDRIGQHLHNWNKSSRFNSNVIETNATCTLFCLITRALFSIILLLEPGRFALQLPTTLPADSIGTAVLFFPYRSQTQVQNRIFVCERDFSFLVAHAYLYENEISRRQCVKNIIGSVHSPDARNRTSPGDEEDRVYRVSDSIRTYARVLMELAKLNGRVP